MKYIHAFYLTIILTSGLFGDSQRLSILEKNIAVEAARYIVKHPNSESPYEPGWWERYPWIFDSTLPITNERTNVLKKKAQEWDSCPENQGTNPYKALLQG